MSGVSETDRDIEFLRETFKDIPVTFTRPEGLSVVGATIPPELCGAPDRNLERCVFLTDHEGGHSWQRESK